MYFPLGALLSYRSFYKNSNRKKRVLQKQYIPLKLIDDDTNASLQSIIQCFELLHTECFQLKKEDGIFSLLPEPKRSFVCRNIFYFSPSFFFVHHFCTLCNQYTLQCGRPRCATANSISLVVASRKQNIFSLNFLDCKMNWNTSRAKRETTERNRTTKRVESIKSFSSDKTACDCALCQYISI